MVQYNVSFYKYKVEWESNTNWKEFTMYMLVCAYYAYMYIYI